MFNNQLTKLLKFNSRLFSAGWPHCSTGWGPQPRTGQTWHPSSEHSELQFSGVSNPASARRRAGGWKMGLALGLPQPPL